MDLAVPHAQSYEYVRSALGMVVGLNMATILNGCVRFIQHPTRHRVDGLHLGWAAYMLVSLVGFWWWEQGLVSVKWDFLRYVFVISYAMLLFAMSALLFPQDIKDYDGYRDYFLSRRRWFFGLLMATVFVDVADTLLKGPAYYAALGIEYPLKSACMLALACTAAFSSSLLFHRLLLAVALTYQVTWTLRSYFQY
jgi:hypothetical protein